MNFLELVTPLYAVDWNIFMTAAHQWLTGGDPYGLLSPGFGRPGAFAYPPTALPWLCLFLPLAGFGYPVWTALQLGGWWLLVRKRQPLQMVMLCWSPLVFHLLVGQSTLAIVLVLWAATLAKRRGFWWGMALAWSLTKPQVALVPAVWLLWNDRNAPERILFLSGIITGTIALAVPPTLLDPGIWTHWLHSLGDYRARTMQMAPWQGFGALVLLVAALLWYHRHRGNQAGAGWQWWLSAALFPQTALYSSVSLIPLLRPQRSYWTLSGLAVSSLLVGPATEITLPIILSGHILSAWFINGGPRK